MVQYDFTIEQINTAVKDRLQHIATSFSGVDTIGQGH